VERHRKRKSVKKTETPVLGKIARPKAKSREEDKHKTATPRSNFVPAGVFGGEKKRRPGIASKRNLEGCLKKENAAPTQKGFSSTTNTMSPGQKGGRKKLLGNRRKDGPPGDP